MEEGLKFIAPSDLNSSEVFENHKLMQEISERMMLKETMVILDKMELTPMTNPAASGRYYMHGIPVFDPTKTFILPVNIPESKKPWYKRLCNMIKRLLKIG